MIKFLVVLILATAMIMEETSNTSKESSSNNQQFQNINSKEIPLQRKLGDTQPYLTNHIIHHQPYYAAGYAPYSITGPMMLPPPSPMMAMPPMVPPPPPIFTSGQLPIQNAYHIIHNPQQLASPWNANAFPHVFNPYLGNGWPNGAMHPSQYSAIPYGLHPFSYPGVGYPYGMSPYYNPYMSMMSMGSISPFLGASMYPMSHIAGAYGAYGPSNPLNVGETYNTSSGVQNGEYRSLNDVADTNRKLSVISSNDNTINNSGTDRLLKDVEVSKKELINTLLDSIKQLESS